MTSKKQEDLGDKIIDVFTEKNYKKKSFIDSETISDLVSEEESEIRIIVIQILFGLLLGIICSLLTFYRCLQWIENQNMKLNVLDPSIKKKIGKIIFYPPLLPDCIYRVLV